MAWIGWLLLFPALPWLLSRVIHRGLAAPRLVENAEPQGLLFDEARVATVGGKHLFGWWIPGAQTAPSLVLLHGWGGNAQTMLPLVPALHQAGFGLLLLDARCHGRSDDDSFASLPRFAEDLESAIVWLKKKQGSDQPVGLIGHSVGAGAALLTASRRRDIAAVVSLAAFAQARARAAAKGKAKKDRYVS